MITQEYIDNKKEELENCLESIDKFVANLKNELDEVSQAVNRLPGSRKTLNPLKTKLQKAWVSGRQFRTQVKEAGEAHLDYLRSRLP